MSTTTKTPKFTEDTLMVCPLNVDLLNEYVKSVYKEPKEDNVWFEVSFKTGLVKDSPVFTDNEAIYSIMNKQLIDGELCYVYHIEFSEHAKTEKGQSFGMTPKFAIRFTLDELVEKYLLPEMSLKEFMKGRYDYNSRIDGNMHSLTTLFGYKD